jgi:hypothetical protein
MKIYQVRIEKWTVMDIGTHMLYIEELKVNDK